jgi:hypothetical protein
MTIDLSMKRASSILILLFAASTVVHRAAVSSSAFQTRRDDFLMNILDRSAGYCDAIRSGALSYVCEETIQEEIFQTPKRTRLERFHHGQGSVKNEYVYDYQLIKQNESIVERRTLLSENGVEKHLRDAPLKTERFSSLKTVYAPADFVGRSAQNDYLYEYRGEDRVLGRKAFHIISTPKDRSINGKSYGKIWVDAESFGVLKIERDPESTEGYHGLEERAAKRGLRPVLHIVHEFAVDKNGVRFPSRTEYVESYAGNMIPKFEYSRATVEYSKYKFFIVEVSFVQNEKIK